MKKIAIIVIIVAMFLLLCSFSATILLGRFELKVYHGEEVVLSKQYKIKTSTMMNVIFKYNGNFYEYYSDNKQRKDVVDFSCINEEIIIDIDSAIEGIEYPYENSKLLWDKEKAEFKYVEGNNGIMVDRKSIIESLYSTISAKTILYLDSEILPQKLTVDMLKEQSAERGKFSTLYKKSTEARKHNIALATEKLCGQKIKSGQKFSFNETVGRRTEQNGFKRAKIISQGEFVDGVGGGVCQVSTTLYNAWIRAGLDAVNAVNHSLPVSYVPPSMDAMVSSKNDLVLLNNTNYDVYVKAYTKDDQIVITIYGIKTKERVELRNEIVSIIPCCEYEELDVELNWQEGETHRILAEPKDGLVSNAYKDIYIGDKLVRTEKLRTNTYLPQKGRVVKRKIDQQQNNPIYSNLYNLIDDNTFLCVKKVVAEV